MTPKAAPKASGIAVVLAFLLCVGAVLLGRDAAIEFGALTGAQWIGPSIESLLATTVQTWMLPAGVVLAVVGVALVVLALVPRLRTHRPSGADGVWLRQRSRRVSTLGVGVAAVDRIASVLVGLLLSAVGAAAAAWQLDRLPPWAYDARRTVENWGLNEWASASWWPWALTAAALVSLLLGLRWIYAHRPRRRPSRLSTLADKHANVDLVSAARSAAAAFEAMPEISSATARVSDTRTTPVVRIFGDTGEFVSAQEDAVAAADRLRTQCLSALDGLAVEVQVLVDTGRTSKSSR